MILGKRNDSASANACRTPSCGLAHHVDRGRLHTERCGRSEGLGMSALRRYAQLVEDVLCRRHEPNRAAVVVFRVAGRRMRTKQLRADAADRVEMRSLYVIRSNRLIERD